MSSVQQNPDRRHDLDALRASAMILGIIYHGALSLALGFPWMVQDPSASKPLYVFQSWVHGFRMPLFFIISGFFTAMLWKKRGSKALVAHRFVRILLPCLIGAITLVPLCNLVMFRAIADGMQRRAAVVQNEPPEKNIWAAIGEHQPLATQVHLDQGFQWTELHPEFQTTALSWAAIQGDLECTRLLIERGCDPSIANPDGNTPLHAAMFFGHFPVAEYLLEQGADITKKNNNQETPVNSLRIDAAVVPMIAGMLRLKIDQANITNGRNLIENKLSELDLAEPASFAPNATAPKTSNSRFRGLWNLLISFPAFSYLWFLWFLWWYAVCFAILAWFLRATQSIWMKYTKPLHKLNLCSPWTLPFWILMTAIPIFWMDALGYIFGPDTSVTIIPAGRIVAYYALFFLFGAIYYLSEDTQAQLGRSWQWLLPLTLFVVFPLALEINLGTFGLRDSWKLPVSSIRPLSVLSQSLFAWWMSLACIGLFHSCLNKQRPWIRYLSDSSYWLYVAHLPLVVMLQTSVLDLPWNSYGKLFAISAVSILLLLLSYQIMVRHTPIGWLLNGRRRAAKTPQQAD